MGELFTRLGHMLGTLFFSPGSTFSALSLVFALGMSIAFLRLRKPGKSRRLKVMMRALFPRWLWRSRSMRADIGFFFLNVFVTGGLIGWGLLSYGAISQGTADALTHSLGAPHDMLTSPLLRSIVLTVALFIAYDFAYWLDHYIKHKVPVMWAFHRVHHTAEVLSPLTAFRMHPIDSLVFYNITAVIMGVTHGALLYAMGAPAQEMALSGTNIILLGFIFVTVHLQHSHIPIRFTGLLGRLIFSPAHHHIHHSTDRAHYDSNLGSCLAIWDWMFGTLILPEPRQKPLSFGASDPADTASPHSLSGSLLHPFVQAARSLLPKPSPVAKAPEPPSIHMKLL